MAYPSTATLVAASGVSELQALSGADQDALRASAINTVEEYTGQSFATAASSTKVIDGKGGKLLYLPQRLSTLTSLSVTGSSLNSTDVVLSLLKDRLHIRPLAGIANYYERAMSDITGEDHSQFTIGVGTVSITGVWGWTDAEYTNLLSPITLALRYDMEDQAVVNAALGSSALLSYKAMGATRVKQDRLEVQFREGKGPSMLGITARVERLIAPFIFLPDLGHAF